MCAGCRCASTRRPEAIALHNQGAAILRATIFTERAALSRVFAQQFPEASLGAHPTSYVFPRHLQGKMRIGLAKATVLVALAHAIALTEPLVADDDATAPAGEASADGGAAAAAAGSAAASSEATSSEPLAVATTLPAGCEVLLRAPGCALPPVVVDARKRYSAADMVTRLEKAVVMLKQVRRRRLRRRGVASPLTPGRGEGSSGRTTRFLTRFPVPAAVRYARPRRCRRSSPSCRPTMPSCPRCCAAASRARAPSAR